MVTLLAIERITPDFRVGQEFSSGGGKGVKTKVDVSLGGNPSHSRLARGSDASSESSISSEVKDSSAPERKLESGEELTESPGAKTKEPERGSSSSVEGKPEPESSKTLPEPNPTDVARVNANGDKVSVATASAGSPTVDGGFTQNSDPNAEIAPLSEHIADVVSALTIKFLNKSIQDSCIQTIWQTLSDPYFFAQPEEKIDGTGAAPLTRSPPSEVDIRFLALQVIENELRKLKSRLSYFESQREDRRRFMSNSEKKIIADRIDEYNNRILSKKSELKDAQNEYILLNQMRNNRD